MVKDRVRDHRNKLKQQDCRRLEVWQAGALIEKVRQIAQRKKESMASAVQEALEAYVAAHAFADSPEDEYHVLMAESRWLTRSTLAYRDRISRMSGGGKSTNTTGDARPSITEPPGSSNRTQNLSQRRHQGEKLSKLSSRPPSGAVFVGPQLLNRYCALAASGELSDRRVAFPITKCDVQNSAITASRGGSLRGSEMLCRARMRKVRSEVPTS
jgi:hypothetical protein